MDLTIYKYLTVVVLLFNAVFILPISSEKILVLQMYASKSHKITYMGLIEELARRGHQIKIVSPIKPFKTIANVTEVYTFNIEDYFQNAFDPFETKAQSKSFISIFSMMELQLTACRKFHDLPQVQQLLEEEYDLIFSQIMGNDCILGIIHKLKAPTVFFSPIAAPAIIASKLGFHYPHSFVPNFFLDFSDKMTFTERFVNLGVNMILYGIMDLYSAPKFAAVYREKLGDPGLPSTDEVVSNASLVLSNGHFSLGVPRPNLPDVIDVGGIHSKAAGPLPQDLEDFVSKSGKDGFILFSMGTVIKEHMMPESKRKILINAFAKLKQQVIWKWDSENMTDLPKNVKLSKWLPQQDLLGHPGIKIFITHCGGGGTEEAIYHGVPLIGMPMISDQPLNAKQAKKQGFLVELDWNELSEDKLLGAINEVLGNPVYRNNVQRLSTLFRDQPEDPLSRGVYWVEYVMRHKGAPHLRSASRKLNTFQYHSIDVILAYLGLLTAILWIVKILVVFVCRFILNILFKSRKEVSVKKKRN